MSGGWSYVIALVVYLLYTAPYCGVFAKADKRWWIALIPVLNVLLMLKIVGRPWWWVLLLLIPIVNIGVWAVICLDLAESFGRGLGFAIGLVFLPFIFAVLLWLGSRPYAGPAASPAYRIAAGT